MARGDGTRDHLRRLRDVQPAGRLRKSAQSGIGECTVVIEASVTGVGHRQQFHGLHSATARGRAAPTSPRATPSVGSAARPGTVDSLEEVL